MEDTTISARTRRISLAMCTLARDEVEAGIEVRACERWLVDNTYQNQAELEADTAVLEEARKKLEAVQRAATLCHASYQRHWGGNLLLVTDRHGESCVVERRDGDNPHYDGDWYRVDDPAARKMTKHAAINGGEYNRLYTRVEVSEILTRNSDRTEHTIPDPTLLLVTDRHGESCVVERRDGDNPHYDGDWYRVDDPASPMTLSEATDCCKQVDLYTDVQVDDIMDLHGVSDMYKG